MPLHMAKVRSDNRGPEGAADERARNSESTAGEGRHRPNVPEVVLGRNGLCCGTVHAESGYEPDPQETQSGETHAMSRCEQPERGTPVHQRGCLCVGGRTRVDDDPEDPCERVKEIPERKHAQESQRVGQTWANQAKRL